MPSNLLQFLEQQMAMSEVYQPAIIRYLLEHHNSVTKTDLASELVRHDDAVQEQYEEIVMQWPEITLTGHGVVRYERSTRTFALAMQPTSDAERQQAVDLCSRRIEEWKEERRKRRSTARLTSSIRYRVLKAAGGKCLLCGSPASDSPLDVDHIVPRKRADKDGYVVTSRGHRVPVNSEDNLQALCFRCNRGKRDQDDTDFRSV